MTKLSRDMRALVKGARNGDVGAVGEALAGGFDPDTRLPRGRTALAFAARHGHEPVVTLLLDSGADPNICDEDGRTALAWSLSDQHLKSGDRVIDRGALWVIDRIFSGGDLLSGAVIDTPVDPVRAATAAGVVSRLVDAGAIADLADATGETPLMLAAAAGYLEACRSLLAAGANLHAQDSEHMTALTRAALAQRWAVVDALVEADRHAAAGPHGGVALTRAMEADRPETVRLLLDAMTEIEPDIGWALVDWAGRAGHTTIVTQLLDLLPAGSAPAEALMAAAAGRNPEIVTRLLASGTDVNTRNEQGGTPLMAAHPQIVPMLIAAGADVGARSTNGWTALMAAAARHDICTVMQLVAAGADPNTTSGAGESAADLAERERYRLREQGKRDWDGYAVARALESAAELAALDPGTIDEHTKVNGEPILVVAAELGRLDIVEHLLRSGANTEVRGPEDATALMKAAEWGHDAAVGALLAADADVAARSHHGETPLMWASTAAVVEALIAAGADPDARDDRGRNALGNLMESYPTPYAGEGSGPRRRIVADHVAVINALVESGVDPNGHDSQGWTPLIAALRRGVLTGLGPPGLVARTLIELGARIDEVDTEGRTALIHAAERCDPDLIELLIDAGADIDVVDSKGRTALEITRDLCGSDKPEQVLQRAGEAGERRSSDQ